MKAELISKASMVIDKGLPFDKMSGFTQLPSFSRVFIGNIYFSDRSEW